MNLLQPFLEHINYVLKINLSIWLIHPVLEIRGVSQETEKILTQFYNILWTIRN